MYVMNANDPPGTRAEITEIQNAFGWGKSELAVTYGAQVSGAARDAGSTPTSVLRAGLAPPRAFS